MTKKIASFFVKIIRAVAGIKDKLSAALDVTLRIFPTAFPFIEIVAELTPTQLDDAAIAALKKYPHFFDATLTEDEKKLALLGVATELFKSRYPTLSTTIARFCVQLAYLCKQTDAQPAA